MIENLVKVKIQAHECGIRKLTQTQEKITSAMNHHLNLNWGGVKDPKKALKILLNALYVIVLFFKKMESDTM